MAKLRKSKPGSNTFVGRLSVAPFPYDLKKNPVIRNSISTMPR